MPVGGAPSHAHIDFGYLDWRLVQDVASCANGFLKGQWLVPQSGLIYIGKMESTPAWPNAAGRAIMVYGTTTVTTTLSAAYEAAGLPMPPESAAGAAARAAATTAASPR